MFAAANRYHWIHVDAFSLQSSGSKTSKTSQQPSISITALPRQNQSLPSATTNMSASVLQQAAGIIPKPPGIGNMKPGQSPQAGSKASFVICEICDGYIKDLDQLRNHMQWMHKVKVIKTPTRIHFRLQFYNRCIAFCHCRFTRKWYTIGRLWIAKSVNFDFSPIKAWSGICSDLMVWWRVQCRKQLTKAKMLAVAQCAEG